MSHSETLMARDGHTFRAFIANPSRPARSAIILAHDLFGLTAQMRTIADSYAADGHLTVAPALFDRVQRDLVWGDSPEEIQRAQGSCKQIHTSQSLLDIAAVAATVRHSGKVAIIGYGWGGLLSWLAAASQSLNGAVCYYGIGIAEHLSPSPKSPTLLHFAEQDPLTPPDSVERIRAAYPQGLYYCYSAAHSFDDPTRPQCYAPAAAQLARSRTQAFLAERFG